MTTDNPIKTKQAEQHAGGTVALAAIFGISHSSVSQWGEHLPMRRVYELRVKRPTWFYLNGNMKPCKETVT